MARSVFVDHAAEILGISRRTVYYRIRAGRLRTIRTRGGSQRVTVESIEELLRERFEKRRSRHRTAAPPDAEPAATDDRAS